MFYAGKVVHAKLVTRSQKAALVWMAAVAMLCHGCRWRGISPESPRYGAPRPGLRWEGTTLVVETDRIAGYFDHEGTPQSDQIKTVERFIPNADYSRLDDMPDDNGSRQLHEALRPQAGLRVEA